MNEQEKSFVSSLFHNITQKEIELINNTPSEYLYNHYEKHVIPKQRWGYRVIYEPDKQLKRAQRRINKEILQKMHISDYAFAYVPGRSVLDNAKPHVNSPIILKLDIHHFFDNIPYQAIFNIFKKAGYSSSFSKLIANLTTVYDFLPQGAPTSPTLSNIYLKEFDEKIGKYCRNNNITYTRYSDDLTFSMQHFNPKLVTIVKEGLESLGLEINKKKSKIISGPLQKRVTGIVVNEKPQVPIHYRRKIRQEIYYISKFGLPAHLKHLNISDGEAYINSLLGKINFVLQINKNDNEFKKYKTVLTTPSLNNLRSQLKEMLE